MSDEERLQEALNRNALDNQMLELYHECFTDRHLDLAALLMEQWNESQKDPTNKNMQFTPDALKLIPWAKAVVTMQLIQIAGQSTTNEEERAKIGSIQANGQEVIALNYKRCKGEIDRMLVALNDAGSGAQEDGHSPSNKAVVDQMTADIRRNEQQMKTILEQLESGVDDSKAMSLAVEYAAIKSATAAMVSDLQIQDPQKMMHDDWIIDNFTKPLQKAASDVLNSSAYPELKVWANAMDSLTAFTQQGTVEMLNNLLLNVANSYKANRQNIQSKMGRRTSRAVQAATQLNRATYFLRAVCALDDDDWADACIGLSVEARALASKLGPEDEVLQDWGSNVALLEQYAKEVEKNIDVVIEEREKYGSTITSLLHSGNSVYEQFINAFDSSHVRIAEHVEPGTVLDKWATAIKDISIPPDYKIFETINSYNKQYKGAISKHEKTDTLHTSGLLYLKNMIVLPANEWKAVVRTSKCKITDAVPANAVEWAFAATELCEYLKKTEENMKIISEEYKKHKLEIDASNLPSPVSNAITPPTAPSDLPLDEIAPPTPLPEAMERRHSKPNAVEWAFAATELCEYLKKTEENMKIISEEYKKHKLEIDASNLPSPVSNAITPPTAPSDLPLDEIAPPTPLPEAMERRHSKPVEQVQLPEPAEAAQELTSPMPSEVKTEVAAADAAQDPGATMSQEGKPDEVDLTQESESGQPSGDAKHEAAQPDEAPAEPAKPEEEQKSVLEAAPPAEPATEQGEAPSKPCEDGNMEADKPDEAKPEEAEVAPEHKDEDKPRPEETKVEESKPEEAKPEEVSPVSATGSSPVPPAKSPSKPDALKEAGEAEPVKQDTRRDSESSPTPKKKKKKKSVTSLAEGEEEGEKKKKKKKRKSVTSEGDASPSRKASTADGVATPKTEAKPEKAMTPAPPQDDVDKPKPSRVIQIRPIEDRPKSMPLDVLADSDSDDDTTKETKLVHVKPKTRTLAQAVRKNPQIARGIIFIQPRDEDH
eukprot:TRINITY_DN3391_c2_g2_i1.p1 TRINITY_DN3391_c2_g2~~TRINITY_DN3391_c2_g2_i1.p1  ORF type:complete len:1036 (+),score=349.25 TRINITY_DN3391_c2_g2_i1:125-3109(+)